MPLDLNRIRALCFDIDGTLRDTDDQFVVQVAAWLSPFRGLFPNRNTALYARRLIMWLENPGTYLQGLADRLGIDRDLYRLANSLDQLRRRRRLSPGPVVPGVPEMLAALHARYPLAVVSARGQHTTLTFLEGYDLVRFFTVIVTGQTCQHTKPYPDPIEYAARQMAVPVENCLMIGDTTADIRAGRLAQAQTVGVLCGFGEREELEKEGADQIVVTTLEILDFLLS
ncbi:MAG: hypothetical protein B6D39_04115 [Anaerolineae bacterium UTCFX2]|mgnify:CR=1 FL=1|nr:HAD family hydrolase [Anaerolineae bacterium]MCZ7552617.1 HAD family hydrolase [Anaerolineales bacterium]OQY92880.1 MAG: hypothetical protein B6D39_04115 [Anaerolineae bacterium UTCFX2]